jgi:hypothetical protein
MGKISSYPSDSQVTTSDRLIGSDNENSNETKNFEIGDIINLAASIIVPPGGFVPYTGASSSVDLGAFTLTTSYLTSNLGMFIDGAISLNGNEGNTSDVLVSQGPGATPTWSNALSQFVPYSGATGNVDLGVYDINADVATFTLMFSPEIYVNNIYNKSASPLIFIGSDSSSPVGLLIDTSGNTFKLGDYNGNFNSTYISIFDSQHKIEFNGGFYIGNGEGTTGEVLTSQGAGASPIWTSLAGFVPYTGATTGVNLGIYSLTAANVNANNVVPVLGGSGNIFFGGAGGYGVARNGVYALGTDITILGDSTPGSSTYIQIDGNLGYISFYNGVVDLSNTQGLQLSNGQGSAGDILTSSGIGFVPSWSSLGDSLYLPFLIAYSDLSQNIAAINVGQAMIINQVNNSYNININANTVGDLTRITFYKSGIYNIQFSAQLKRTSGGASATVDIWFRKGGADIPNSNTSINLQANAGVLVASWNLFYYVDVSLPNPYIEIMWASTNSSISIQAVAANAVHPATPSVILTVNQISA